MFLRKRLLYMSLSFGDLFNIMNVLFKTIIRTFSLLLLFHTLRLIEFSFSLNHTVFLRSSHRCRKMSKFGGADQDRMLTRSHERSRERRHYVRIMYRSVSTTYWYFNFVEMSKKLKTKRTVHSLHRLHMYMQIYDAGLFGIYIRV